METIHWERPLFVFFGGLASPLEVEQAFQLRNTLQSVTGREVRVSAKKDLPDALARRGTVFLVGTAATSALVAAPKTPVEAGTGTISVFRESGREWVVLTGADAKGVEAAVVELELRFWPNAKDATIRITGVEKGAALGHRTGGTNMDLP